MNTPNPKHTPHPWNWDNQRRVLVAGPTSMNKMAVMVAASDSPPSAEDASLIEAAPDLYLELELSQWGDPGCSAEYGHCFRCGRLKTEGHAPDCPRAAALAKAEGKQPTPTPGESP